MDLFREESVRRETFGMNVVSYWVAYTFMIFFAIGTIMNVSALFNGMFESVIAAFIQIVIFAALAYACYVLKNNQKIEYDYTFTNGVLDVAKIINNNKRKKLLSADIKEFEIIAPIGDEGFQRALGNKGIQKRYNLFLNRGGGLYYGIFSNEGTKSLLVFEPSTEMLKLFQMVNPRNVKIK